MLITRTKVNTKATVMVANTDNNKVEQTTVIIPKVDGERKTRKEIEKALPENLKFVSVIMAEDNETLYGLDETIFLKYAVELDPKTRKPIATAEATTEEA